MEDILSRAWHVECAQKSICWNSLSSVCRERDVSKHAGTTITTSTATHSFQCKGTATSGPNTKRCS